LKHKDKKNKLTELAGNKIVIIINAPFF